CRSVSLKSGEVGFPCNHRIARHQTFAAPHSSKALATGSALLTTREKDTVFIALSGPHMHLPLFHFRHSNIFSHCEAGARVGSSPFFEIALGQAACSHYSSQ